MKVIATANYGVAGEDIEFEEEFPDDTCDEEIEETMRELVMGQVDWSWKKITEEKGMIKVKAYADYGFAGAVCEFEEEFPDGATDGEIEETMKELVMDQVGWSWEKVTEAGGQEEQEA